MSPNHCHVLMSQVNVQVQSVLNINILEFNDVIIAVVIALA